MYSYVECIARSHRLAPERGRVGPSRTPSDRGSAPLVVRQSSRTPSPLAEAYEELRLDKFIAELEGSITRAQEGINSKGNIIDINNTN